MNEQKSIRPIVIYHGGCHDGFGAAWAVWRRHGDAWDYYPTGYGKAPPDVFDRPVIIVDFSYKLDTMRTILDRAQSVLILDHHKTAKEDLETLFREGHPKLSGKFDMDHSGAMLAWTHFHPVAETPHLLKAIEDRDLWRFSFAGTRGAHANLASHPMDFELWDQFMRMDLLAFQKFCEEGDAIDRAKLKSIKDWINTVKFELEIDGFMVPCINGPAEWSSDAGHIMAEGQPFAVTYWDQPDGRIFSLRSTDAGEDVSAIAKRYGGGGHRNAAGFKLPLESWPEKE